MRKAVLRTLFGASEGFASGMLLLSHNKIVAIRICGIVLLSCSLLSLSPSLGQPNSVSPILAKLFSELLVLLQVELGNG